MKKLLTGLLGLSLAFSAQAVFTDGDIIEVSGSVANGVQSTITSSALTEFKDKMEDLIDSGTTVPATTADVFFYMDSVTKALQGSTLAELVDGAIVTANVQGSMENFSSTTNPVALPIFDTDFHSSTPALVAAAGDKGIQCNIPVNYDVICTGSMKAAQNDEFIFQIYAGGVAIGRAVTANGISSTKANNFTLIATTTTALDVGDIIEVRCSDSGNTLDEIAMTLHIEFAGL